MSYIQFDKTQLINLKYSLDREFIRSNRAGSYASSTIINCNTRKYHGLLVCPMPQLDNENHVLLSGLDETIIQRSREFHLGVHQYPDFVSPGHKYIHDYSSEPIPQITYRVGGVELKKEMLLVEDEEQILIKYSLLNAHSPTKLRLHPFLAFRNTHKLSNANMDVNTKYQEIENGMKYRMYDAYPFLHMQLSKNNEYTAAPNWFYNLEYCQERMRGYDYREDLYVPGFFEVELKKGESVVFSASLSPNDTNSLKRKFTTQLKKRIPRDNYEHCLQNSAQQFFIRHNEETEVIAGFPWFGRWGRDTFIALPGLTLPMGDNKTLKAAIDTMSAEMTDGLFRNMGNHDEADVNSVDAPLWFFWTIQQYGEATRQKKKIWQDYGEKMKLILNGYRQGLQYNIKMHDNGLVYAGVAHKALTWMDAMVGDKPVTRRMGYNVEINALWYNAVCYALELARYNKDHDFVAQWKEMPEKIEDNFVRTFWNADKGYLADFANEGKTSWRIRPNQIFAASLKYSPISDEIKKAVVDTVQEHLLTPKGLRTLSPRAPKYSGSYRGDQATRDKAYHQGTVWPWLLGHFCEAYLKLHGKSGVNFVRKIYLGFEEDMEKHGIGSISEIYDGDPPHEARGAISQAWSVAELLRIKMLLDQYEKI